MAKQLNCSPGAEHTNASHHGFEYGSGLFILAQHDVERDDPTNVKPKSVVFVVLQQRLELESRHTFDQDLGPEVSEYPDK